MDLLTLAQHWHDQDPDPHTRAEIHELIQKHDLNGIAARFSTRLQFGTAGLRGELGAGPNRMNRVVVAQTAFAISKFLVSNRAAYLDSDQQLSVVIGYDGRINSDIFAKDSAEIIAAAGIRVRLFDFAVPTPVAAFTGKQHKASATIVVTASHNPPKDNGYKVYLGGKNGCSQLVSPQDKEISALIAEVSTTTSFADIPKSSDIELLGLQELDEYVSRAAGLVAQVAPYRADLKITYTAMHGVGFKTLSAVFENTGFRFASVIEQQEPDGSFPTVAFPNPEEPGAMDLSLEHARSHDSDLIIANDPDADRLAVGAKLNSAFQMLTGDQVGLLLAEVVAASGKAKTVANSIVSASLAMLAEHYGLQYRQTLTGFKWISKVENLSYGYEEALGYCVDPTHTPDKDGITAALLIAELAAKLKSQGRTLFEFLDELAERYGHLATGQVSIRVTELSIISKIMRGIVANPPVEILGQIAEFENLELGEKLPRTEGVILTTEKFRVIIRPSGTEPKLKCYLQVSADAREKALDDLDQLKIWAKELLASHQSNA